MGSVMKIILKIPTLTHDGLKALKVFCGIVSFQMCPVSTEQKDYFSVCLSPAISHEDLKARLWTFYLVQPQEKQNKQEKKLTITNKKKYRAKRKH